MQLQPHTTLFLRAALCLPAFTVALATAYWLTLLQPRPVQGARVYLPAFGEDRLAFRVRAVVASPGGEKGLPGLLQVQLKDTGGRTRVLEATALASGVASLSGARQRLARTGLKIQVTRGTQLLAQGEWPSRESEDGLAGGWYRDSRSTPIELRAGLGQGVLAVPFQDRLYLQLTGAQPPSKTSIVLRLEGAHFLGGGATRTVTSDASGHASADITPDSHVVMLHADATYGEQQVHLTAELPVVAGAMRARWTEGAMLVESPIARPWAYVNLMTSSGIIDALSVRLHSDGGVFTGRVPLALPAEQLWAVTSSTFDMRSPARVGWPLSRHAGPGVTRLPAVSFVVDGVAQAHAAEKSRRQTAFGMLSLGVSLAAGIELLLLALYFRAASNAAKRLQLKLEDSSWQWLAGVCVLLGFGALLFSFLR